MTPSEIAKAVEVARDYMGIAADIKADGSDRDPDVDPSLQRVMAAALLALAERCGELEASRSKLLEYETLYFSALNTISELEATISRKALAAVSMGEE